MSDSVTLPSTSRTTAAVATLAVDVAAGFVAPQQVGGAEVMLYNLVDGLRVATSGPVRVHHRAAHPLRRQTPGCEYRPIRAGNRFAADAVVGVTGQADLVLYPNYFTPPVRRSPALSVIHDVQYRYFPEHFSARKRRWLAAAHAHTVARADTVVAISESVREDLLRIYGSRARRVQVVPNPIDFTRFGVADEPDEPDDQTPGTIRALVPPPSRGELVAVAAQYPHKNLDTLIAGHAAYRASGGRLDLTLIGTPRAQLVGSGAWGPEQVSGGDGVRHLGHVDDRTLGHRLRHATAFLHPSLFEGFGMPVAEALGLGVPTICNALPPLLEIAGDLANLCHEPRDAAAWASWMHRAERGDLRRPSAAEAARIRTRYAPASVAARYLDVVRRA